ncbi:MAG: hypothetical protein QG641_324, partial [Candidatus Poribacteria bacterium]|nr:hypothetical protein [Candidatus Poribacteria bacterium]
NASPLRYVKMAFFNDYFQEKNESDSSLAFLLTWIIIYVKLQV